jgi:hypothetical protein
MIANGMPSLPYTPHQIWILDGNLSKHKKGSMGFMAFENVQQSRRVFSMGSIIKRQGGH